MIGWLDSTAKLAAANELAGVLTRQVAELAALGRVWRRRAEQAEARVVELTALLEARTAELDRAVAALLAPPATPAVDADMWAELVARLRHPSAHDRSGS